MSAEEKELAAINWLRCMEAKNLDSDGFLDDPTRYINYDCVADISEITGQAFWYELSNWRSAYESDQQNRELREFVRECELSSNYEHLPQIDEFICIYGIDRFMLVTGTSLQQYQRWNPILSHH